ncbi:MAG: hypothetical protein H7238_15615 [Polaromonas sp.]|nr:hypothetical protein [Polaromonas sp.]
MSLFNWFSGKSSKDQRAPRKPPQEPDIAGLSRDDRTRPVAGSRIGEQAASSARSAPSPNGQKSHRHAKRELLYASVREAMIRAGVLSASYKFKVLSLDPRGDQFMVMMDLAQAFGGQTERLADIEVMIAQNAKSRYNIRVTAVYWRMNEMVSVGQPHVAQARSASAALPAVPPAVPRVVEAAPLPVPVASPASRYEPIQADEVAAFRQALAAASAAGPTLAVAKDATTRSGLTSYTLLTGFEDTEMPDSPVAVPALSATQYGELN